MHPQEAQQVLWNVDEGVAFHFCNGRDARNLKELLAGINSLSVEEYRHHVYFDHNDFANWLLDIIGDDRLARDIFGADQHKTVALVRGRIHYLEHRAKQQA